MLEIVSHKIAQSDTFVTVSVQQLPAAKRWCAVCNTAITSMGYLDREGYAGAGVGAILCQDHAFAASQSATQPTMDNMDNGVQPQADPMLATEAG